MPDLLASPQRGDLLSDVWQASGVGVPPNVLNIHDSNVDLSVLLYDVTNTGSGGVKSRLAGTLDIAGTVNATFDLNTPPYLAPLYILPGLSGIYGKCVSTSGRLIQCPTIIEKVHYQGGVDSELKYSFDVKGNARAGVLIYPAAGT